MSDSDSDSDNDSYDSDDSELVVNDGERSMRIYKKPNLPMPALLSSSDDEDNPNGHPDDSVTFLDDVQESQTIAQPAQEPEQPATNLPTSEPFNYWKLLNRRGERQRKVQYANIALSVLTNEQRRNSKPMNELNKTLD